MKLTLAVDFGSTYTKVAAFDLETESLVATARSYTTVESNICLGWEAASTELDKQLSSHSYTVDRVFSCSSAAGGLKMVAIGLTKQLTTKVAVEAALGAGAKLTHTFSFRLSRGNLEEIESSRPDIILLAGGTDGGDEDCILENAKALAGINIDCPVIIAGNKSASDQVKSILQQGNKECVIVDNVLPDINEVNIEHARETIREIFIGKITQAKGLDKAKERIGGIIMPTPLAVLKAASLLAIGVEGVTGFGDIVVADIGGATTDIYSIGHGDPLDPDRIRKGLPEPFEKRTVEGDLGMRYNAASILSLAGVQTIHRKLAAAQACDTSRHDIEALVGYVTEHPGYVPSSEREMAIDRALAEAAVEIAVRRHAGKIVEAWSSAGKVKMQYGKDLSQVRYVIGTGGIFTYGANTRGILNSACYSLESPDTLCPLEPKLLVDNNYILFAFGLLAEEYPREAFAIMRKYFQK